MRKKIADMICGLILIAIGLLIGGKVFGIIDFSLYFPGWWCLFLIVPCFLGIIRHGFGVFNTAGFLFGVAVLLQQNGYIEVELLEKLFVPVIFFLIGFSILGKAIFSGSGRKYSGPTEYAATFAGNTIVVQSAEPFDGCRADAVFGGLAIRLTEAEIKDGAVIDASAIFGGIDIIVPENVNVKLHRTSLFGGASQNRGNGNDGPVLYVNALSMFGGVEIK